MVSWKGGEHGYIPIIVYGPDDVKVGYPGESHQQLGSLSKYARTKYPSSELRVYYNERSNYIQITSHSPDTIEGESVGWLYDGMLRHGFDVSMDKTRVNFLGYSGSERLGELFADMDIDDPVLAHPGQTPNYRTEPREEQLVMPSGRMVRYGDRRPVKVRSHLRRRIVDHLEHPPSYCFCKKSKTVDRARRGLIRRLK